MVRVLGIESNLEELRITRNHQLDNVLHLILIIFQEFPVKNSAFCWVGNNISDPCYGWLNAAFVSWGWPLEAKIPLPKKGKQPPIQRFRWRDCLGGGFKYFVFSPRKLGKMIPF